MQWQVDGRSLAALFVAMLLALALCWILDRVASRLARREGAGGYQVLLRIIRRPARATFALLGLLVAFAGTRWTGGVRSVVQEILTLFAIATVAWILIALSSVLTDLIAERYDLTAQDNLLARKILTRSSVIRRIVDVLIVVVSLSAMLMTFPEARTLGASLLASAGLIGLIAGLAAQPLLTNLIAGLQIALAEPIRIDDVVIVNGDWGWIEEIDVTFVVVRIWDLRRLIVPLSYFLQQPFENWTYKSADLLGYVHVYADYTVPVEAVRGELERILQATDLWDRKVWNLQVTGADEHAVQMRALFSAANSDVRWNLMVHVRERLVEFLRQQYPDQLPRTRVEMAPPPKH